MKTLTKKIAAAIIFIGIFFISGITSAQTVNYGLTPSHTYTVLGTYEDNGVTYVVLRNPWGQTEAVEESYLANIDLHNNLQKQQQTVQMMSNVSKVLRDTAMAVVRKAG